MLVLMQRSLIAESNLDFLFYPSQNVCINLIIKDFKQKWDFRYAIMQGCIHENLLEQVNIFFSRLTWTYLIYSCNY